MMSSTLQSIFAHISYDMGRRLYFPYEGRGAADFLSPSAGFEPAKLVCSGNHANHYNTEDDSLLLLSRECNLIC
jgi:hypothetical protein